MRHAIAHPFETSLIMNFESAQNYYEDLVGDELHKQLKGNKLAGDHDFIEDTACVALNRLPPRYVRHHVDLVYYLTDDEKQKMDEAVNEVVKDAIDFVFSHRNRD